MAPAVGRPAPTLPTLPTGPPRAFLALTVVAAVAVLACWRVGQAWIVYPSILLTALGGALVLVRARRHPVARPAWALLGAGVISYAASAALAVFSAQYGWLPGEPAYGATLLAYVGDAVGLILLLRRDAPVLRATTVLDGLAVTLGVAATAVFCFEPLLRESTGGFVTALVLVTYPAGDVLGLAITLGALATLDRSGRARWGWLAAGFAVMTATDTLYTVSSLDGTYTGTLVVDMFWPFAAVFLVVAAWRAEPADAAASTGGGLWVLPLTVTTASLVILTVDGAGVDVPTVTSALACAAIVAVFVRMALTFSEIADLAETRHQATHDDLTDLANRRALYLRLENAARRDEAVALLVMDINRFKDVNDALGHAVGDDLLVEVARRLGDDLADVLRAGGVVARLGGDEFAVLLPGGDRAGGERLARRVGDVLAEPFVLDDITLHVGASIGVAVSPEHATERTALMRCADVAMYEAKRARVPFALFTNADQQQDRTRLESLEQLRTGMTRGELFCWFQPKADLRSGRIVGAEALVRWQHPQRGVLPPDAFLPLVEQSGLMRQVTEIVLDRALSACQEWRAAGHDLTVAVNLSAANLLDADLTTYVAADLQRFGLPGRVLRLEITEDVLLADPRRAAETIEDLRGIGVAVSMDDYGTGYSSLSHLRQLVLDELKLDRSFVTDLTARPRDLAIVSSTIDLAHALDLIVVAEGVESDDDWRTLTRLGCDQAQGYLLSRPVPAADFLALVRGQSQPRVRSSR